MSMGPPWPKAHPIVARCLECEAGICPCIKQALDELHEKVDAHEALLQRAIEAFQPDATEVISYPLDETVPRLVADIRTALKPKEDA